MATQIQGGVAGINQVISAVVAEDDDSIVTNHGVTVSGLEAAAYVFGQVLSNFPESAHTLNRTDKIFSMDDGNGGTTMISLNELSDIIHAKYGYDPLVEFSAGVGTTSYSLADIEYVLRGIMERYDTMDFPLAQTGVGTSNEVTNATGLSVQVSTALSQLKAYLTNSLNASSFANGATIDYSRAIFKNSPAGALISFNDVLNKIEGATGVNLRDVLGTSFNNGTQLTGRIANDIYAFLNANRAAGVAIEALPDASQTSNAAEVDQLGDELLNIRVSNVVLNRSLLDLGGLLSQLSHTDFENDTDSLDLDAAIFTNADIAQRSGLPVGSKVSLNQILHDTVMQHNIDLKELLPDIFAPGATSIHYQKVQDLETVLNQSVGTTLTPGNLTPLYLRGTLTTVTLPDGSSRALTSNELAVFRLRQFLKAIPEVSWDEFIGGVGYLNSQDPSKLLTADNPYNTGHLVSWPTLLNQIKAETGVNPENIILGQNLPADAEQDLTYSDLKVYLRAINTYLGIAPGTGLDELSFSAPVLTDAELGNLNSPLTPAESANLDSEFQAILNQQVQAANAVGVSQQEIDTVQDWLSGLMTDFSSITLPPNYTTGGVTYTYAPAYFELNDLLAGSATQQVSAKTQSFASGAAQTGTPNQTHVISTSTTSAGLMARLGLNPNNSTDVLEAKRILNAVIPGLVTKDGHVTLAAVNATSNFSGLQTRGVFNNPGQFLDHIAATITALNGAASTTASAFKTSLLSHLGWSSSDATAASDALTGLAAISPSFVNKVASGQAITADDLTALQTAITSKRSSFVASPEASFLTAISPQPNPAMYITQPDAYILNLYDFLTAAKAAITNSTPTAANGTTINSVYIRASDLLSGITPDIQIATTTNGVSATQNAATYFNDQSRQLFGNLFTGSGLSATNDEDRTTLLSTLQALMPQLAGKIRAGANLTAADLDPVGQLYSSQFSTSPFTAIVNAEYTGAANFGLALKKLGEYIATNSTTTVGGVKQITLADLQSGTHGVTSAWIQAFAGTIPSLGYPSDMAEAAKRLQADLAKYTPTLSTSFAAAGGVLTQTNLDSAAVLEVRATLQELRPMYYLQQLSAGLAAMKADIAAGTFSTSGLVSTSAPATFESANTGWVTRYFPNLGYGTSLVGGKAQAKDDFYQDLTMFCPDLAQKIIPALTVLSGGATPTYTLTSADLTSAIATLATTVSNLQTDATSVTMLVSADRVANSALNFTMVTTPPALPPLPVHPVLQTAVPSDHQYAGGFTEAQLTAAASDLTTLSSFIRLGPLSGSETIFRANTNQDGPAGENLGTLGDEDSISWSATLDPDKYRFNSNCYSQPRYLRPDDIYNGSSHAYAYFYHGINYVGDLEVRIHTESVNRPANLLSDLGNPTQANYDTFVNNFATGSWTRDNLAAMSTTVASHIQTEKNRLISGYQTDYNAALAQYNTDLANYNSILAQRQAYDAAVTANQSLISNHQVMLRSSSFGYMEMAQHIIEENPLDFPAQIDQLTALTVAANGAAPVVTTPPAATAQTVDLTTARVTAAKTYINNLLASDSSLQSPYIASATAQNVITGSVSTTALTWQSATPALLSGFTNAQVQSAIDYLQRAADSLPGSFSTSDKLNDPVWTTVGVANTLGGATFPNPPIYALDNVLGGGTVHAQLYDSEDGVYIGMTEHDFTSTGNGLYSALGLNINSPTDVAKLRSLFSAITPGFGAAGSVVNHSQLNAAITALTNAKNANTQNGSATAVAAGAGLYGALGLDPTSASDRQIFQNTLAQLGVTGRLTQSTGDLTAQDLNSLLTKLNDQAVLNTFGTAHSDYVTAQANYVASQAAYTSYQTATAPLQALITQAATQLANLISSGETVSGVSVDSINSAITSLNGGVAVTTPPVSPTVDLTSSLVTAAKTYINNLLASDSNLQSPYIASATAQNVITGSGSTTALTWQSATPALLAGFTNAQVQTVISYLNSAANTLPANNSASYGLSDVLSGNASGTDFTSSPPGICLFNSSGNNLWSQLGLNSSNANDVSKLGNLFSSLSTGLNTGSYTRSDYLNACNIFQAAVNANTQNASATAVAAGTGLYGALGLDPTNAADQQTFQNTLAQLGITGRLTQSTGNLTAQDLQGLLAKLNDSTVLQTYTNKHVIGQLIAARDSMPPAGGASSPNLATVRANLSNVTYADALKQVQQLTAQVAADRAAYNAASGDARNEKLLILTARMNQLDAANARLSTIRANDLDPDVITGGEAYLYQYADRIKQFVTNAPDPLTYGNTRISISGEMRSLKDIDADLKRNYGITLIASLVGNTISDTTSITRDQLKSLVNGIEAFSMSDQMHSHFLGLGYNVTPTSFMGGATSVTQLASQIGAIYAHGAFPKPDNVGMGMINGKPVVLSGDALAANRVQYWLASTNISTFIANPAGDGSAPLYSNTPGTPVLMGDDPYNPGHQISFQDLMHKIEEEPARGTVSSDASQKVYRLKELIQEARSEWPTTEFTPRTWMKELGFDPSSSTDITAFKNLINQVAPSLNANSWGLTNTAGADIALSNSITLAGLTTSLTGYDDRGTTYINANNIPPSEDPVLLATLGPNWRTQRLNITQVTQLATALDPLVGHGCKISDMLLSATTPTGSTLTGTNAAVALVENNLQALINAGTASNNGGRFPWTATYTANGQSYSLQGVDQLAQRAGLGNLLTNLMQANGANPVIQGASLQELQALLKGLKIANGEVQAQAPAVTPVNLVNTPSNIGSALNASQASNFGLQAAAGAVAGAVATGAATQFNIPGVSGQSSIPTVTPLGAGDGFGAYRTGSELQSAINAALANVNVAQATRDNPNGNPYTVNMNWMLDNSEPARQDFTFHNLSDDTNFEAIKATLQSFQFVDVDSAQAPNAVRAAAFAAPNVLNEAPLSSTELKQQISDGDLYIDSKGVFYLNRQRTNARDLVLASRMVAGDKLEDQLTGLMNNINNRNVDIQIAKELESCTTEADFKAKLTDLKTKYGVDDVMSRITGGSQTDANYGDYSKVSGILQGVIDVKTKDAELDQQNLQNLNNQIEANNTAMTTLLKAFEELMKGLIQALH